MPLSVEVTGVTKTYPSSAHASSSAPLDALLGASLCVAAGTTVALLGPSGCGKTTLLRIVAGLEVPDAGEVRVGDRVLTSDSTLVPAERRQVGMVFQDWALFPHLSVAANVAYGLPKGERGGRRASHAPRVVEALELVGLSGLGDRQPGTLSGGQQQRVALARALAPRPSVLLLDEPFSNLDAALRVSVRSEVHRLLDDLEVTTLFVTHDQEEAFVLGDEVAVMDAGEVVQQAPPAELYGAPATAWVAGFVGDANLLDGHASGSAASTALGMVPLRQPGSGEVEVLVRPELVEVVPAFDGGRGVVEVVEYYGHDTVYLLAIDGVVVRARAAGAPVLRRGDRVAASYAGGPTPAWPRTDPAGG